MSVAVFGYGSLADPASAARTLGRPLPATSERPPHPASLRGWRRRWSQARDNLTCEKTFARASDGSQPTWVLGLNIERLEQAAGPALNGVLIEVSEAELSRLDIRELRYRRLDVTSELDSEAEPTPAYDAVLTYVARADHFAPEPPDGAVVLASYASTVERAFASFGNEQLRRYRETTDPPPVEVVEAVLVRDRIPPGNPRDW